MPTAALHASLAFEALQTHYAEAKAWHMRDLFAADPARFNKYSLEAAGIFLDYSKHRISQDTLDLLLALVRERGVEARREAMFNGEKINTTEDRAVLHTALRAPANSAPHIDGQDVGAEVHAVLEHMRAFSEEIRSGAWKGYTGEAITDIVNIGIGGSDLGPSMVCRALRSHRHARLNLHFVANVDGHDLATTLAQVDPATTLFIIASKTFTTAETMLNAHSARRWFLQAGGTGDVARRSPNLASIAATCSASGTGSAAVIRSGRRSA
jgi:glucose-6-phosphate isomerase